MNQIKIKETVNIINKNGIYHLLDDKNKIRRFKPWLGDIFSFLYDRIMEKSVFPKKFQGSINKHHQILKNEFKDIHGMNILELASGSGDAVIFLNSDNAYTGVDVSKGLLQIACKKLDKYRFSNSELYLADACDLPFQDNYFDIAICNLSLNFFQNIDRFILELQRVLKKHGTFYCSIPIPEKKKKDVTIHGTLYSVEELRKRFQKQSFNFEELPYENGALLYFKASLRTE
jgi:ubiquinone/menaquinone biosynthesis C-methylase UbiE